VPPPRRRLLQSIFPRHVVEYMALAAAEQEHEEGFRAVRLQERLQLARQHKLVSVLFADIVGFTAMCKEVSPCGWPRHPAPAPALAGARRLHAPAARSLLPAGGPGPTPRPTPRLLRPQAR
jgi:hypothetical protein